MTIARVDRRRRSPAASGTHRRRRAERRHGTAAPPAPQEPADRAGLRRPAPRLPRRLLRLPALPQRRPEPAPLHRSVLRRGRRAVLRVGQLLAGPARPDVRPRDAPHDDLHVRVDPLPVRGRARPRGLLQPALPAGAHPAGTVPDPVAAAADRVGVDLVVDVQQRVRRGQLRPPPGRCGPGRLAHLAALGADLGHHRQHLDRHPVQPGHPPQRPAEHPHRAVRGRGAGRGDGPGSSSGASPSRCCGRSRRSRCCWAWSTRSRCST